jgi:hypothetical protein
VGNIIVLNFPMNHNNNYIIESDTLEMAGVGFRKYIKNNEFNNSTNIRNTFFGYDGTYAVWIENVPNGTYQITIKMETQSNFPQLSLPQNLSITVNYSYPQNNLNLIENNGRTKPPTTEPPPPQPPTPNVLMATAEKVIVLRLPVNNNIFGYEIESESLRMAGVDFPGFIESTELNNKQKQTNMRTDSGVQTLYILDILNVPKGNYIINIRIMNERQMFSEPQRLSVTIRSEKNYSRDTFQNVENTDTCYSNYQMFLLLVIILLLFGAIYYANKK